MEQDIYAETATCDAPMPCGPLQFRCPSDYPCPDDELTVDDPDALQCALQTLGGGEPAYISWAETDSEDFGIFERDGFIYVDGEGNAEFYVLDYQDLNATFSDVQRGSLIEASQLEACTSAQDVRSRFECLAAPLADARSVCQEGGWVDISE